MLIPVCPECETPFPGDDINVAKDVAYCRKCGVAYSLSGLVEDAEDGGDSVFDLNRPPKGAWFCKDMFGVKMGAQQRSWGGFVGAMVFGILWDSLVSIFVALAIAVTFKYFSISLPDWFPLPNDAKGNFGGGHLGAVLFLWLFLTPFILIGLGMPVSALVCLFGSTEMTIERGIGRLGTKVWGIGWMYKFEPEQIDEIDTLHEGGNDNPPKDFIFLHQKSGKKLKFGSSLSDEQRAFLVYALRQVCKVGRG
jgi:hypothetical protein